MPYFFFPKEGYHLVPVDKQRHGGVGETKEAEGKNGDEETALAKRLVNERASIDLS
jgi:hypothetical protein